jgi:hypothetical protein
VSRQIWSREKIQAEIAQIHDSGFDITQSRMEAIDSRLTSAAIRYFGSWRAAVEAAGIDYAAVAAAGRRRRSEKITKWSKESILEEIRRLHAAGEDLSSTVVRRKYLSLYATARRKDHFGSWAEALSAAGIDYASIKKQSRERRRQDLDWKEQLIKDYDQNRLRTKMKEPRVIVEKTSLPPDWAKELIRERLAELYEREKDPEGQSVRRLQALIRRSRERPRSDEA